MKKSVAFALRAILSIVLTTFSLQVWGVDCSSTHISLSTQVDVDNFQSTYGGGGVCDVVSGSLNIRDSTDITNLDGLSGLTSAGSLFIYLNDALTNLDGLSSLTSTVRSLIIRENPALTNLDGLANLTSVNGTLFIYLNDALTNLDGLSNITSLDGDLEIRGNDVLTNLNGLSSVTGTVGNLDISSNHALTNLNGLSNITSLNGYYLQIYDNTALTNLDGLARITSVPGWLVISSNHALTNINGLSSITSISQDLNIENNRVLSRCTALALLLGWPDGPPNDNVGGFIAIGGNKPGCNSVKEVLDSSIGLSAPSVTTSVISSGQVTLTFTPAYSLDTSWPITGYQAQCLAEDQSITTQTGTSPIR